MPGFAFGPIRPNTRADLPLTSRVLVPAVRRSLAEPVSGAAKIRVGDRNGIVPAIATPVARICRRVTMDFSLSLDAMSISFEELTANRIRCVSDFVFRGT